MGKVLPLSELTALRDHWKTQGKKVVFTNGVFDILHRGHLEYLASAKALGDALIVGVNSDASVRRIKGPLRPVVSEGDRSFLVSQLVPVDVVCLFDQDTPFELIGAIVPDLLVKGADWPIDKVVGKDIVEQAGGKVMTLPLVPKRSTSNIIARIRELYSIQEKE